LQQRHQDAGEYKVLRFENCYSLAHRRLDPAKGFVDRGKLVSVFVYVV
jgi:hypothetical protein